MKTYLNLCTQLSRQLLVILFFACSSVALGIQPIPDIAQSPLELTPTVNPNVMILLDDSGSMDFEVMTPDVVTSGLFFSAAQSANDGDDALELTPRAGCELITAAFGGYAYGVASPTNEYIDSTGSNCYVAPADDFRFRSALFNSLYFNPAIEYQPWVGFFQDATGNDVEFGPIDVNNAPFDPFDPSLGTIDLLAEDSVVGFMRYYIDANNDGIIQTDEERLLSNATLEIQQKFANWFSYYRSRQLRAKALLGKFIVSQTGTQIGLVRFNVSTEPSLEATEMNVNADDGAKRALLNELYATQPNQLAIEGERSPLIDRYFETAEYLADRSNDVFPANVDDPAAPGTAGECQANHIFVASDGFRDLDLAPQFQVNEDGNGDTEFDGGVFADNFSRTFADIAIQYYEDDLRTDADNVVSVEQVDINRYPSTPELEDDDEFQQHVKTHLLTTNPAQSLLEPDQNLEFPTGPATAVANPPWENPLFTDFGLLQDLVHAAYNGRGLYLDTATSESVNTELTNLTNAVATGVGSTTPVAINTQIEEGDFVLFRTFFDSSSISGDVVAQFIDLDGSLNETESGEPIFEWSAAQELDVLVGDDGERIEDRIIVSYSDNTNNIGQANNFEFDDIDAAQQGLLDNPPPAIAGIGQSRLDYLRGDTSNEGPNFTAGEFRIRPETTSTGGGVTHFAKLGTIANSTPVFIGLPSAVGRFGGAWPNAAGETYFDFQDDQANRDASLIVGANDGMVHVFDTETGRERFAYVPELIFPELFNLTNPDFQHQFFVDSTPSVSDAYIRETSSATSPSWNTIAIGGLGAGGRGYYALNLTEADAVNSVASALEAVMWEFGPEDDPDATVVGGELLSDLGLSFGKPIIAMSNDTDAFGNQRWVAIFGNGYNSTSTSGNAVIYMLFIDEGLDGIWNVSDLVKIDTGVGGAIGGFNNPNGIADVRAIDVDGNGTVDRLYAGDLRGNLHVVDVSSDNPSAWSSALNRFILFEARNDSSNDPQPITTRPIVVPATQAAATSGDPETAPGISNGFIVIFTTGSFFTESDSNNTDIQSIYGVFDDLATDDEINANTLVEQTLSNVISDDGDEVRIVSDTPVSLGAQDDGSFVNGWFINLDVPAQGASSGVEFPGERAVRELVLINDVLFINTVIPQENSCDPLPGGFGLALNPFTGSAGTEVIFDINNDSEFDENDNINIAGDLNVVVGTRFDSTPSSPVFSGTNRIVQQTDGRVIVDPINPDALGFNQFVGRRSWREVVF